MTSSMQRLFFVLLSCCIVFSAARAESPRVEELKVRPDQVYSVWNDGDIFYCTVLGSKPRAGELKGVTGDVFIPYVIQLKKIKRSIKRKGRATRKLRRQLKDLKQIRKQGDKSCLHGGSDSNEPFFDVQGNMSSRGRQLLGIPANLESNIFIGKNVFEYHCTGCHNAQVNRTFPMYRSRTSDAPMFFTEELLPDEDLAHLTAYLNRFRN